MTIDIKAIRDEAESIRINAMVIDKTTVIAMCDEIDRLRIALAQPAPVQEHVVAYAYRFQKTKNGVTE